MIKSILDALDVFKPSDKPTSELSDKEKKELEDMVLKARNWSSGEVSQCLTLGEFAFLMSQLYATRNTFNEMKKIFEKVNLFFALTKKTPGS